MKTPEDEAFDDMARRQGMWGGGFPAKRAAAVDKLQEPAQEQEEDWGALAEKQLASIKRDTQASLEDAMGRATHKVMAEFDAQPVQEPFGWYSAQEDEFMTDKIRKEHERLNSYTHINGKFDLALYAAPPKREWVGLMDEELHEICNSYYYGDRELVKLIEAKLKEKNT